MNRESRQNLDFARTAISKLRVSVSSFNKWRSSYPNYYLDLFNHDFRGQDLTNVNLVAAKLKGANFEYANLEGALLSGANLNGANLSHAILDNADLKQARLEGALFRNSSLNGCNLFATIRDNWKISNVTCSFCWITRDKALFPDDPNRFIDSEFESTYGGLRVSVEFPDGFQPIDLLALPYYASRIINNYPNHRIILAGVDTTGEARLVFRLEEDTDIKSLGILNPHVNALLWIPDLTQTLFIHH
jgi:uncharacterized protein YjbI with pentapeptide repeats